MAGGKKGSTEAVKIETRRALSNSLFVAPLKTFGNWVELLFHALAQFPPITVHIKRYIQVGGA